MCLATSTMIPVFVQATRDQNTPMPEVVQEPPARGKFLIASRDLLDPNFAETVVLLVDYDSDGALGVIINRPTQTLISEVLPDVESVAERPDRVWLGGPVAQWQLVMLGRSDAGLDEGRMVMDDLYFSASRSALEELLAEDGEFRLYAGYAGWSPGQLDEEIDRGGWKVLPGELSMVFDQAPLDLWPELIMRTTVHWAHRATSESTDSLAPSR